MRGWADDSPFAIFIQGLLRDSKQAVAIRHFAFTLKSILTIPSPDRDDRTFRLENNSTQIGTAVRRSIEHSIHLNIPARLSVNYPNFTIFFLTVRLRYCTIKLVQRSSRAYSTSQLIKIRLIAFADSRSVDSMNPFLSFVFFRGRT